MLDNTRTTESYIEELNQFIMSAKSPFSGGGAKKIIETKTAFEIIDDISRSLPAELEEARQVLHTCEERKAAATAEAERILQDANDHAATIVSEQEIVRLSRNEANSILRDAEEQAWQIRYWAETTAEETFARVEEELTNLMNVVQGSVEQVLDNLNGSMQQINELRRMISAHRDVVEGEAPSKSAQPANTDENYA